MRSMQEVNGRKPNGSGKTACAEPDQRSRTERVNSRA